MSPSDPQDDLNARGRRLAAVSAEQAHAVWRAIEGLPAAFAKRPIDHKEALAKADRREAARRAVDKLLR